MKANAPPPLEGGRTTCIATVGKPVTIAENIIQTLAIGRNNLCESYQQLLHRNKTMNARMCVGLILFYDSISVILYVR